MLFSNPGETEIHAVPTAPEKGLLHLLATDQDTGESYQLTIEYLRTTVQSIRGGTIKRFDIAPDQITWLHDELDGDRITHFRRDNSRKKTFRPIYRMGIRSNGLILTSYFSQKRIRFAIED